MKKYILLASAALLTACGPDGAPRKAKVRPSALCPSAFVSGYETLKTQTEQATDVLENQKNSHVEKLNQMKELRASCKEFFGQYAGISCEAKMESKTQRLEATHLKASCDLAEKFFARTEETGRPEADTTSTPAPTSTPTPTPAPTAAPAPLTPAPVAPTPKPSRLQVKVLNVSNLRRALAQPDLLILGGRVDSVEALQQEIASGAALCTLTSSDPETLTKDLHSGQVIDIANVVKSGHENGLLQITLSSSDHSFTLGCFRSGPKDFTLDEVRNSFQGLLEIVSQHD